MAEQKVITLIQKTWFEAVATQVTTLIQKTWYVEKDMGYETSAGVSHGWDLAGGYTPLVASDGWVVNADGWVTGSGGWGVP